MSHPVYYSVTAAGMNEDKFNKVGMKETVKRLDKEGFYTLGLRIREGTVERFGTEVSNSWLY